MRSWSSPINRLYKEYWGPLHNFFLPSMKLVSKTRVGSRWLRKHDRAQTAYQRLEISGILDSKQQRRLRAWYHQLDPFALAEGMERELKRVFSA